MLLTLHQHIQKSPQGHKRKPYSLNPNHPSFPSLKLYHPINDKSQYLTLNKNYTIHPSQKQIFANNFICRNLSIKNNVTQTQITWKGMVDLRFLKVPLSELIDLGSMYIEMYPKQDEKPVIGKQLNKLCFVTFKIKDQKNRNKNKKINRKRLQEICQEYNNEVDILKIDEVNRTFTVEIQHFTKYSFNKVQDQGSGEQEEKEKDKEEDGLKQIIRKRQMEWQGHNRTGDRSVQSMLNGNNNKQTNLITQLIQKHTQNLLKQKKHQRSTINTKDFKLQNLRVSSSLPQENIQQIRHSIISSRPNKQLQQQIQNHNRNHGHEVLGKNITGHKLTIGVNGVVSSLTTDKNTHLILFNNSQNNSQKSHNNLIDTVITLAKNSNKINQYIFSNDVQFEVRRVLVLYMICFRIKDCKFGFEKYKEQSTQDQANGSASSKYKIKLVKINKNIQDYYKQKYLKNWFEWVINQDQQNLLPKNSLQSLSPSLTSTIQKQEQSQLLHNLALRRTQEQAQKYLKYNRLEIAQFLGSIQDELYRENQVPGNIGTTLMKVSMGNMIDFQGMGWVVRFAVYIWYFRFSRNVVSGVNGAVVTPEKILLGGLGQDNTGYSLQRYMLLTLFQIPFREQIIKSLSHNILPLWWYISNENTNIQQSNCLSKSPTTTNQKQSFSAIQPIHLEAYKKYRYNILFELTKLTKDPYTIFQFYSRDRYLDKNLKDKILNYYIKNNMEQAEGILRDGNKLEWVDYSDMLYENKAVIAYGQYQYIKALELFGKCTKISNIAENILIQLLSKQEIICGFHKKTIQKIQKLLTTIQENLQNKKIQPYLLYLNIILSIQQLNRSKVQTILQLCYKIKQIKIRKKMLDNLFVKLIKCPSMILLLKRDSQFYRKMCGYYLDPVYRLQFKFAIIQV